MKLYLQKLTEDNRVMKGLLEQLRLENEINMQKEDELRAMIEFYQQTLLSQNSRSIQQTPEKGK
jgi:hypothetical protein